MYGSENCFDLLPSIVFADVLEAVVDAVSLPAGGSDRPIHLSDQL
jgi:hypothetical protein